jgi:hypothetical protein
MSVTLSGSASDPITTHFLTGGVLFERLQSRKFGTLDTSRRNQEDHVTPRLHISISSHSRKTKPPLRACQIARCGREGPRGGPVNQITVAKLPKWSQWDFVMYHGYHFRRGRKPGGEKRGRESGLHAAECYTHGVELVPAPGDDTPQRWAHWCELRYPNPYLFRQLDLIWLFYDGQGKSCVVKVRMRLAYYNLILTTSRSTTARIASRRSKSRYLSSGIG